MVTRHAPKRLSSPRVHRVPCPCANPLTAYKLRRGAVKLREGRAQILPVLTAGVGALES